MCPSRLRPVSDVHTDPSSRQRGCSTYFTEEVVKSGHGPKRATRHFDLLANSTPLHSFILTTVKTSNLIQHYPTGLCSGEVMFPVRYELCHISEEGILHSHRRENLTSYKTSSG
jgi:hypothetical protein